MKPPSDTSVQVIEPPSGLGLPSLREVIQHRELLVMLAVRDIKVRYKETTIGLAWAIVQPLLYAAMFSAVLTMFGRVPSGGVPYPVFLFSGLILWLATANAFSQVAMSTTNSQALISKVYFPRLILPLSGLGAPISDFSMGLVVLVIIMIAFGAPLSPFLLLAPLFLAALLVVAFGAGLWMAALAARFRDVPMLVPLLTQLFFWTSGVLYPLEAVPDSIQPFLALNPVVGILETFRWLVLPEAGAPGPLLLALFVPTSALLVLGGLLVFARAERSMVDTA